MIYQVDSIKKTITTITLNMKTIKTLLLLLISICLCSSSMHAQEETNNPIFILVHGTFQWGGQWNLLKSDLVSKGYVVYNPTLTGLGEKNYLLSKETGISTHINDI